MNGWDMLDAVGGIDPALLEYTAPPRDRLIREAREYITLNQSTLPEEAPTAVFAAGERVRHPIMGPGTVLGADEKKGAYLVQFDGAATPRAISFKAKLERE